MGAENPFGEFTDIIDDVTAPEETKGWIGEHYDEDAGLQYLNARYYDPELGLFIQPDWWEVTRPGVGTNRYSYSFNDPVNLMDPGGNLATDWKYSAYKIGHALGRTAEIAATGARVALSAAGTAVTFIVWGGPLNDYDFDSQGSDPNQLGIALTEAELSAGHWYDHNAGQVRDRDGVIVRQAGLAEEDAPLQGGVGYSSFNQLKSALGSAGEGNVWHHIVEQCRGKCNRASFSSSMINNTKNVAAVPDAVNRRLNAIYSSKQDFTGGRTLRDWLSDKSFEEQYEYGTDFLEQEMERYREDPENYH
ncbi:MAG: RHS repeat-associated core domain-containing protein [Pseudomonadota bacterium]